MRAPSEGLLNILKEMVPTAQLTADAENKRLIAVATAADHEAIQKIVEQFESSTPPEEPRKLAVYPVTAAQKKRFEAVLPSLQTEMPGLQVLSDADPGSLTIWARPSEQIKIAELIQQLEQDVPQTEQLQLVTYTCAVADPTTISTFVTTLFPDAKFVVNAKSRRILVWARPEDHEKIKPALEQLGSGGTPGDFELQFQAYPLSKVAPEVAVPMLQQQLPEAKIVADATSKRVLAWASKADQAVIAKAIEQLQSGADDQEQAAPGRLPARRGRSADAPADAHQPRPDGPFGRGFPDRRPGGLGHAGRAGNDPQGHRRDVQGGGDGLQADHQGVRAEEHHGRGGPPRPDVGGAHRQSIGRCRREPSRRRGSAARPSNAPGHPAGDRRRRRGGSQIVRRRVQAGTQDVGHGGAVRDERVPLGVPESQLHAGHRSRRIRRLGLGQGPRGDQGLGRSAERATGPRKCPQGCAVSPEDDHRRQRHGPCCRRRCPERLLPPTPPIRNGSTASARPTEHEMIKTILAEINVEGDPGSGGRLPAGTADSATAMSYAISLLTQAFPRARLLLGTEPGQFVAWASAKDHEGIKALVDRLNAGPPPEESPEATVYSLQHISATTALNLLTTAVPKAKLSPDTEDTRRLTAFASPADQAAIKAILEKINVAGDAAGGATVGVYKLEGSTAASSLYYTLTVFRTAFPKATFSLGAEANQFVAWATAKDHAGIKTLVEQLNAAPAPEDTPKIALYPLQWITAATATTVLQAAVPKATFTADPADPQRLTVLARPADHERIKAMVAEINVEGGGGGRSAVAVYVLEQQTSPTAMSYALSLLTQAFPAPASCWARNPASSSLGPPPRISRRSRPWWTV